MRLNADVQVYGYYMFKDGQEARVAYPVEGVPEAHCLPGGKLPDAASTMAALCRG